MVRDAVPTTAYQTLKTVLGYKRRPGRDHGGDEEKARNSLGGGHRLLRLVSEQVNRDGRSSNTCFFRSHPP